MKLNTIVLIYNLRFNQFSPLLADGLHEVWMLNNRNKFLSIIQA
jgi:hypothetical protein